MNSRKMGGNIHVGETPHQSGERIMQSAGMGEKNMWRSCGKMRKKAGNMWKVCGYFLKTKKIKKICTNEEKLQSPSLGLKQFHLFSFGSDE